ncbi:MAG: 50S ribosomal protein L22 [Chloroflexi bacterium]|nr:50S ribosomal protein L22 [Chloroflexota bacterium]
MRVVAKASGLRRPATKVRLILDEVRGKPALLALEMLRYMPSPAAREVAKVVRSAVANAENNYRMLPGRLKIVEIAADEGPMFKRFRPRSRGRMSPILRRSCHVTVTVDEEA